MQKKAAEFNFRNQLKVVKKKEFTLEEEDKEVGVDSARMFFSSAFFPRCLFEVALSATGFANFLSLLFITDRLEQKFVFAAQEVRKGRVANEEISYRQMIIIQKV